MHSSRMRTVLSSSRLPGGGGVCPGGGVYPSIQRQTRGVSTQWVCVSQHALRQTRGSVCPGGCVCLGVCLPRGGVSQHALRQTRGSVCPGGCVCLGVCPGGCVSQHALRQTPALWTEFLTHASEDITLPQLRCGR